ncbi:hypothetical protein OEA41_002922 [Lepraria neglecta]|uniref:Uncharacterized protein n=1 Tax=Lepraria neglecta TaxID=209136 RepID=A0AAD9Z547_9LECA|nr:hypothetical protein OEA41_002922 [Lepraria neglecta]
MNSCNCELLDRLRSFGSTRKTEDVDIAVSKEALYEFDNAAANNNLLFKKQSGGLWEYTVEHRNHRQVRSRARRGCNGPQAQGGGGASRFQRRVSCSAGRNADGEGRGLHRARGGQFI